MYLCHAKRYFEENEGHGRSEYRECVCISAKNLQYFFKGWTGIKTLAMINTVRKIKDKESTLETRYYISSLEPDPITILKSVRSHWAIENELHWVLMWDSERMMTEKPGMQPLISRLLRSCTYAFKEE